MVDLHWNVAFGEVGFLLDFDELWADRQVVRWEGTLLPALGPEWLFLITDLAWGAQPGQAIQPGGVRQPGGIPAPGSGGGIGAPVGNPTGGNPGR